MREANVKDLLSLNREDWDADIVMVGGPSGAGKSFFVHKSKANFTDMDSVGHQEGDKWIIDPSKLAPEQEDFIAGTGDNLSHVADYLRSRYEDGAKLTYVFIRPTTATWRSILKAKLRDGIAKELPESWLSGYKSKLKMSDQKLEKTLDGYLDKYVKYIRPDEVVVAVNDANLESDAIKGWHSSK